MENLGYNLSDQSKQSLIDKIKKFEEISNLPEFTDCSYVFEPHKKEIENLRQISENYNSNLVPMIGCISSGKTTFINCLLEMDLLESSNSITSKFVCLIQNCDNRQPSFYSSELCIKKDEKDLPICTFKEKELISRGINNVRTKVEEINKSLEKEDAKQIRSNISKLTLKELAEMNQTDINELNKYFYILKINIPLLSMYQSFNNLTNIKNLSFVDLPGMNEDCDFYIKVILPLVISTSISYIFILDLLNFQSNEQMMITKSILEFNDIIKNKHILKNSFIIVNKADLKKESSNEFLEKEVLRFWNSIKLESKANYDPKNTIFFSSKKVIEILKVTELQMYLKHLAEHFENYMKDEFNGSLSKYSLFMLSKYDENNELFDENNCLLENKLLKNEEYIRYIDENKDIITNQLNEIITYLNKFPQLNEDGVKIDFEICIFNHIHFLYNKYFNEIKNELIDYDNSPFMHGYTDLKKHLIDNLIKCLDKKYKSSNTEFYNLINQIIVEIKDIIYRKNSNIDDRIQFRSRYYNLINSFNLMVNSFAQIEDLIIPDNLYSKEDISVLIDCLNTNLKIIQDNLSKTTIYLNDLIEKEDIYVTFDKIKKEYISLELTCVKIYFESKSEDKLQLLTNFKGEIDAYQALKFFIYISNIVDFIKKNENFIKFTNLLKLSIQNANFKVLEKFQPYIPNNLSSLLFSHLLNAIDDEELNIDFIQEKKLNNLEKKLLEEFKIN